ncbi:MAG: LPS export ABC transporter permease LptF [Desulfobulbaceae bacterium]|jgi:lipopolysaccharide export system permease protein|nr:LPS export ABC transporter permease LptF [Desulfobulbaceae bacterium]
MNRTASRPLLLYSYLITEMLAPFFASFLVMNAIFFLVKLIPFLNFSLELSIGAADFIRLLSYTFPNMFLYTIPMAAMIGVTIGFSRLSSDAEILALKAAGISPYQILPPVLIVALAITCLTAFFSVRLIPTSETAMRQLTYQLLKEKVDKGIKEYQFTEALGDLVVHVGHIDKETGAWKNVWVSDMRGVQNPTITMAATGSMRSDLNKMNITIALNDGSLNRPDTPDSQVVRFKEYVINIPLKPPQTTEAIHRGTLTMPELIEKAREYGWDSERARVMLIEYHKRLALPVGCLFLTVLGLPFGLQAGPGKKAIGIPLGLAVFIGYYVLFTVGKMLARESTLPVAPCMWAANIFFLMLALLFIQRVTNEQPLLPEPVSRALGRFFRFITLPFLAATRVFRRLVGLGKNAPVIGEKKNLAVRGEPKGKIFHFPDCDQYFSPKCTMEFQSAEIARQSGYRPCLFCQDLADGIDHSPKNNPVSNHFVSGGHS